jgi:hypothetical protein
LGLLELSGGPDDDLLDVSSYIPPLASACFRYSWLLADTPLYPAVILYYMEKPVRKIELWAYSLRVMPDVDFRLRYKHSGLFSRTGLLIKRLLPSYIAGEATMAVIIALIPGRNSVRWAMRVQ